MIARGKGGAARGITGRKRLEPPYDYACSEAGKHIHYYLLLRVSPPRPKRSLIAWEGLRGFGDKAAYAAMIYGFAV